MSSQTRKPSIVRRFFGFVVFKLVPLLLILGCLWSGYWLLQAALNRVNEQVEAEQRRSVYVQTATALASPVSAAHGDARHGVRLAVWQEFVTNTPHPSYAVEDDAQLTAAPSVEAATATPPPALEASLAVSMTPRPLPTLLMPGNVEPRIPAPTAIPTQVSAVDRRNQDLMNILLLGNDGELTNDGFIRTDTMIIVSINRTAGTVAMLSLPRDLYVYMPGWTMQRLNVAYIHGETSGWTDGGFGLLRETIFYNLGINVHFYAMVDLTGFKDIVDTLGGIDIGVDCALQDYPLIGADVPDAAFQVDETGLLTLPVGYYHMNGAQALWYARSRGNSSDFDRGRRQQQVLRAIWRKARDTGQLANIPQLWTQITQVVKTNLAFEDMLSVLPIALNLDSSRMEQFTMRRLYDTTPWQTPDGDYVQLPNYDHIRELLDDFYQPPTENQVVVGGARVAVYNGTANTDWDRVAAERLGWDGLNGLASGAADSTDYTDTLIIDYTGQTKGSRLGEIVKILNVKPENIRVQPDPNRQVDYEVILGSSYNSCTFAVLPIEGAQSPPQPTAAAPSVG